MRKALEPELVASLAGKLSDEQLLELEKLAEMHPNPAENPEEEKEQHISSLRFHARLSEFSGNMLLGFVIGFMSRILTDLTVYRRLYDKPNYELWKKGREHQIQLVTALRVGDAQTAQNIMKSHMQIAEELMKTQEASLTKQFMGD